MSREGLGILSPLRLPFRHPGAGKLEKHHNKVAVNVSGMSVLISLLSGC